MRNNTLMRVGSGVENDNYTCTDRHRPAPKHAPWAPTTGAWASNNWIYNNARSRLIEKWKKSKRLSLLCSLWQNLKANYFWKLTSHISLVLQYGVWKNCHSPRARSSKIRHERQLMRHKEKHTFQLEEALSRATVLRSWSQQSNHIWHSTDLRLLFLFENRS